MPYEIGLYFFLTLTGFLITRALLRDRSAGEASGEPWRRRALGGFLKRRAIRILLPCYVALLFAWACRASDLLAHPWVYLAQVANFHIAMMPEYPPGTAHYWSLAIQNQFYVLWPLLIYFAPLHRLVPLLIGFMSLAPLTRWLVMHHFPQVAHTGAITTAAADYFGMGAMLALAMARGLQPGGRRLVRVAWAALAVYAVLYYLDRAGHPVPGVRHFKQTLVAVVFIGLISATLRGLSGLPARMLGHPAIQHIGKLSYGFYLFHATMPMALGFVLPFLWLPAFDGPLVVVRLAAFALASWGAAWLCWRYLEQPLEQVRRRVPRVRQ